MNYAHTAARFNDRATHASLGLQAYLVLIQHAALRRTLDYGELTRFMKWGAPHIAGHPLARVEQWCLRHQLPPLTVLVVQADGGRPGLGFIAGRPENFEADRERVFDFDWISILPPTTEDLAAAFTARSQS